MPTAAKADGELILLPGSTADPAAVALLAEVTIHDAFMLRSRLRTPLPVSVGPCRLDEIAGATGDRLEAAGIRFAALARERRDPALDPVAVTGCVFDGDRLICRRAGNQPVEVAAADPALLVEARYQYDRRDEPLHPVDRLPSAADTLDPETVPRPVDELPPQRVLFVWPCRDLLPLACMDSRLDYTCLAEDRRMTVTANFERFLERVGATLARPVDRRLCEYAFALAPSVTATHDQGRKRGGLGRRTRVVSREYSNADAVHRMLALLHVQWYREMGWAGRIVDWISRDTRLLSDHNQ